jgi:hypothetical protein
VGGRGIDYKFKKAAEVLIGFLPSSKRDFVQFKGRSSRAIYENTCFSLVCDAPIKPKFEYLNNYFQNLNSKQLSCLKSESFISKAYYLHNISQKATMLKNTREVTHWRKSFESLV